MEAASGFLERFSVILNVNRAKHVAPISLNVKHLFISLINYIIKFLVQNLHI